MRTEDVKTFCNGTEYELFLETNCYQCDKFMEWDEATDQNPVCPIEDRIAAAMIDETLFPSEFIKQNYDNGYFVPHCTEKNKAKPVPQAEGQLSIFEEAKTCDTTRTPDKNPTEKDKILYLLDYAGRVIRPDHGI